MSVIMQVGDITVHRTVNQLAAEITFFGMVSTLHLGFKRMFELLLKQLPPKRTER